jgi:hypothetical protein
MLQIVQVVMIALIFSWGGRVSWLFSFSNAANGLSAAAELRLSVFICLSGAVGKKRTSDFSFFRPFFDFFLFVLFSAMTTSTGPLARSIPLVNVPFVRAR